MHHLTTLLTILITVAIDIVIPTMLIDANSSRKNSWNGRISFTTMSRWHPAYGAPNDVCGAIGLLGRRVYQKTTAFSCSTCICYS